jgi:DNA-3-methyladenine glycosylase
MEWKRMLAQDAVAVARQLIGWSLYVREEDGTLTGGTIIETEAYTAEDAASHSYRGETPRNRVMFGAAGNVYVYFTYGMHWCVNIVTGAAGDGQAVLIRAIRPEQGIKHMRERRNGRPDPELTNGPAKVCQALGITGADNGAQVNEGRFMLVPPAGDPPLVQALPRIGIRHDTHRLWRFIEA